MSLIDRGKMTYTIEQMGTDQQKRTAQLVYVDGILLSELEPVSWLDQPAALHVSILSI